MYIYAKRMTQLVPFPDESDGGGFLRPEMAPLTTFASAALQLNVPSSVQSSLKRPICNLIFQLSP